MLALALAYPLIVHASILWPEAWLKWLAIAVLAALPLYPMLRAGRWWAWLALAVALAASAGLVAIGASRFLLYLPPVLIPLSLLVLFGSSLRSGQEPLVSRIARFERGTLSDDLAAYTRRLTLLWSLLFVALTISAIVLAIAATPRVWSLATNFIHYLVIGAAFVGEYAYRRWRFRHLPHAGFIANLRLIAARTRTR
ncbi:MAG TPA: hypothetical protein VE046_04410 [Steroidobacteraceae bacterium]|nr:hypothetical protein [Steroidobacteraceae bacterium]